MSTSQQPDGTRLHSDQDQDIALANAVLDYFEVVTTRSEQMLATERSSGGSALANIQTLTAETALTKLKSISADKRKALRDQIAEPSIARLITKDETGKEEELFIFRGTPYAEGTGRQVASYKSAKGRLASLNVGDEVEIITKRHGVVQERSFESIEKAELHPLRTKGELDSSDTVIYRIDDVPMTIVSLRALLKQVGVPEEELGELEALLQQGRDSENVFMGLRRAVVRKMALRDRPLLDKLQDEIFRLPLNRRIALLGPPGSGKTTTLIKRLSLKLDSDYLDEDEKRAVSRSKAGEAGHADSWFMFTPTELLKLYLKEAFNREGVPAPEARMKTWETHRRDIARLSLGILRIRNTGSVMRPDLPSLTPKAIEDPIGWFEDFDRWQKTTFWTDLGNAADTLADSDDPQLKPIVRRIQAAVEGMTTAASASPFVSLERVASDVEPVLKALSEEIVDVLKKSFSRNVDGPAEALDELAIFLDGLTDNADLDGEDGEADVDDEDDETDAPVSRDRRTHAFDAYLNAIRAAARAAARGRAPGKTTRAGRILEWLGSRAPPRAELVRLGRKVNQQAALRRFRTPTRRYLTRMPTRYRAFRSAHRGESSWYHREGYKAFDLAPLEVDAVILAMLNAGRELLRQPSIVNRIDEDGFELLATIRGLWANQIVVDEATDFSPIQLACMVALVDPATGGFVACGDFNQRITAWGSRSEEQLRWAMPDLDLRPVRITYRHSRQLNDLAQALAAISGHVETSAELPPNVENDGFHPILGLSLDGAATTMWLVERITEIEELTGSLPSVAVLVDAEGEIQAIAGALDAALADLNIRCVACPNGQVVGQDNDVRVFSVEHIKGLEFEAVFFVGIDKLAARTSDVFEKHLYVGATRAAMYLGVTSSQDRLPAKLGGNIEAMFGRSWKR